MARHAQSAIQRLRKGEIMANILYETENYSAHELRGGLGCIVNKASNQSVVFQPGDDVGVLHETMEALEEVPENRRNRVFDVYCSQYI